LISLLERSQEQDRSRGTTPVERQALESSDYLLPAAQLTDKLERIYQAGQEPRLRRFLQAAPVAFFTSLEALETVSAEALERGKDNRLRPILDAIAVIGVIAAGYEDDPTLKAAHEAFWRVYERARRTHFPTLTGVDLDAIWVWGEVIKRVYILGAALVEQGRFAAASDLIEQPIDWDSYWRSHLWSRHALVETARANRMDRRGLVTEAIEELKREPALLLPFGGDMDRATDRLCQFDFLQCVHVVHLRNDDGAAYPSFAWYYKQRTEPIVSRLLADPNVRRDAIPEMDDARLAAIITVLDRVADRVAFAAAGWSGRWSDPMIPQFLEQHVPKDPKEA
jgi:hypothetical protein